MLIVEKPHNLLSVPGRGEEKRDSLLTRVRRSYPSALVIHRLDMETSGLVLFALNHTTQKALNLQFEKRQVEKHYLAVVRGKLPGKEGVIEMALRPDLARRPLQVVDEKHGKSAKTKWSVLGSLNGEDESLVLLKPESGRTHQLRVHMLSLGTPIIGTCSASVYSPSKFITDC